MRILLIDVVRTTAGEVWPGVEHSIGLMSIAACLRRRFGVEAELRIETLVSRPGHEDTDRATVRSWLLEFEPAVVGIRCLSIGKDVLTLVAETVKQWDESCFVVAGGPHASDSPEEALAEAPLDCAAIGEGEFTMIELVERLRGGASIADVRGIAYRSGDGFVRTPPRPVIADLDALPFPDYSLVDLDAFSGRYLTFASRIYRPHANLMTSRGCPYRCMYCHNILGKAFRARSPQSVFGEIRRLHDEYGVTDFQVIDDIFNLDVDRATQICDLVIGSGMKLTFAFPNGVRSDVMTEALLDKMAQAGTKFMAIAVETASPRLQRLIRKNLKLDRVSRTIEHATKLGIITRGFFMVGFPTETEAEARATVDFAVDSSLCGATFFTVVYFPGTPLFELARSMGYFRDGAPDVRRDYVEVGEGPYEFSAQRLAELKHDAVSRFGLTRKRIELALKVLPSYYDQREIDVFLMAHVASSGLEIDDVEDPWVRARLRRHFIVHKQFSRKARSFYV